MAATQRFQRLISADSHVYEPHDLWWKALGQTFGDRTPRALDAYQGHKGKFFYSGYQGCPVARLREQLSRETPQGRFQGLRSRGSSAKMPFKFLLRHPTQNRLFYARM